MFEQLEEVYYSLVNMNFRRKAGCFYEGMQVALRDLLHMNCDSNVINLTYVTPIT
jgi:hypothetical protein